MRTSKDKACTAAAQTAAGRRFKGVVVLAGGVLVCVVALSGLMVSHRDVVAASEFRPLENVWLPQEIVGDYGLGVVDVPAPPPSVAAANALPSRDCPVEVRAIVRGDEASSTFAVLAWGENSSLLGKGQGVRTPHGWIAIASIAEDYVVLRHGGEAYHCVLGTSAAR